MSLFLLMNINRINTNKQLNKNLLGELEKTFLNNGDKFKMKNSFKVYNYYLNNKYIIFKKIDNLEGYFNDYNIYIDSIDFSDGYRGTIDYTGCNNNKPNISIEDITINIPMNVSIFIMKITLELDDKIIRIHLLVDLSLKKGNYLSIIKSGGSNDQSFEEKYSIIILNSSLPNHYINNTLSPYIIHLFCTN